MSPEEMRTLSSRLVEVWNARDAAALDELLAPDSRFQSAVPGLPSDREGFKQFFDMHHKAFPDFHVTVEDVVVEGDRIGRRARWTGTHQGEFMGVAPTGKQVTLTLMTIERVEGGKLAEQWGEADLLGLLQQFGAGPAPG